MRLSEIQRLFAKTSILLLQHVLDEGYEFTYGDAYRDPRVFGEVGEYAGYGHKRSGHKQRIAIDINLFKDGVWLQKTEDHAPIGEWWEQQHELARWGGRFNDGNHYSFEWNGVK